MEKQGFHAVYRLNTNEKYAGEADVVILVWHENQILPAEQYRKTHYPDKMVDIAVCEDPNVQKAQLGDKTIIYHF